MGKTLGREEGAHMSGKREGNTSHLSNCISERRAWWARFFVQYNRQCAEQTVVEVHVLSLYNMEIKDKQSLLGRL